MKQISFLLEKSGAALVAFSLVLITAHSVQAQTNYYFDPGLSDKGTGSGGTGTWDTGLTSDWYNGTTDTVFPAPVATGVAGDPPANQGTANFDGASGTVTVNGGVGPANLFFNGGNYDVESGTSGSINFNFPASTGYYAGGYTGAFLNVASGNVTIDAPTTVNFNPTSNTSVIGFMNSGTGTFTMNGTISLVGAPGLESLNLFNPNGGTVKFNSTVTAPNGISVFTNGTTEFNGNIGGNGLVAVTGTVLLDNGSNYGALIAQSGAILTNGAINVKSGLNQFSRYGGTFGGATADESSFNSSIQNYNGQENLVAAPGGKVDFNAEVGQFGGVGAGSNLVIGGGGIVSLNNSTGQTYGQRNAATGLSSSDVGTEVASKTTLLLMNQTGSATGNGAVGTLNNTVQLDAKAVLGGTGSSDQNVVAVGANTIISPGNMSQSGISSIGSLTLTNGLTATSGLTLNFDIDGEGAFAGADSDLLYVGGNLVLNGLITVNVTSMDSVVTGTPYTFIEGNGDWTANTAPSFDVIAPTGYALDTSYNENTGYDFNTGKNTFTVEFQAAPEPSIYGLLGLGLLALVGLVRLRMLTA
jgi:hypothetical protein